MAEVLYTRNILVSVRGFVRFPNSDSDHSVTSKIRLFANNPSLFKMSTNVIKRMSSSKPIRMWIDGKCFNIKQFRRKSKRTVNETSDIVSSSGEIRQTESLEITVENEIDITTGDNGKLSLSFQLPALYYMKLNQFTDFDIRTLSEQTQTDISFPKGGQDGKLTITGDNAITLRQAVTEIHSVISAIRDQHAPLQFISIPLLSPEIQSNFDIFKNEILSVKDIKGMDPSIFQSPLKLHLTIIVFSLLDEREKTEAINALEEYRKEALCPLLERTGPLRIKIAGIGCMNNNYKKVDVLYANAKIINETEDANLQKIVNGLADYFYEKGLVRRYQENVKLHMTLINTKYRKVLDSPSRRRWVKRESFDAMHIMEKYKDFNFGECCMDSIHLSLMSTKGEDGFYKPLSIIKI